MLIGAAYGYCPCHLQAYVSDGPAVPRNLFCTVPQVFVLVKQLRHQTSLVRSGMSPLQPELAAIAAGRLFLIELNRLASLRVDFAFETTLSGLGYLKHLREWKTAGYKIQIVFLQLASPRLALRRIAVRVRQGGHNVPREDVMRRFARGWQNFQTVYRPLADTWAVYDNSGASPRLLEKGP